MAKKIKNLKKNGILVGKASLKNVSMAIPSTHNFFIDPSFVSQTRKSESLVMRTLQKRNLKAMVLECDLPTLANQLGSKKEDRAAELARLESLLESVIRHGFSVKDDEEDIQKEVRYTFFMFGPGDQRQAQMLFCEGNSWEDAFDIIKEITTLNGSTSALTHESAFLKKNLCQMAKVFAREAAGTAGSFSVRERFGRVAEVLDSCKIVYAEDVEGTNKTPYLNPLNSKEKGNLRETVTTDGMWLFGRKVGLCFAYMIGKLTDEEFENALLVWEANRSDESIIDILDKNDMPAVVQTRLSGSMKGAGHFADLDLYTDGKYDAIVFDSVRKFNDKEWEGRLGDLEICNWSHHGSGWVNMSAPVISALVKAKVNVMEPVVSYWLSKIDTVFDGNVLESSEAIVDIMGAMSARETEEDADNRMLITKALQSNILLGRDHNMWSKVQDKIRAFVTRMAAGKVAVPGAYPYLSVDPNHAISKLIENNTLKASEVEIPMMASNEYIFNGCVCRAIAARSPLTHPNQVKKIELVNRPEYRLYKDVFMMNAIDGMWIDMSGADMDGDECMLALETSVGSFPKEAMTAIIDSVNNEKEVNYEAGLSGQMVPLNYEERVKYLVKNAKRSQVGMLNDAYSAWLELYVHLRNLVLQFNANHCTKMVFSDAYKGNNVFTIKDDTLVTYTLGTIVKGGTYAKKDIIAIMQKAWTNIARLEIYQSREVDAPKTGAGVDEEIVKAMSPGLVSFSMIARRYSKGKYGDNSSRDARIVKAAQEKAQSVANGGDETCLGYAAYTPLGYVTNKVSCWWNERKAQAKVYGKSHAGYLWCLLTDEERLTLPVVHGIVGSFKNEYSKSIQSIMQDETKDDKAKADAKRVVINNTIASIVQVSHVRQIPLYLFAVSAYMHCYLKNGSANKGLAFAWLLDSIDTKDTKLMEALNQMVEGEFVPNPDGYLLSVFKRGDMQYRHVRINKAHWFDWELGGFTKNNQIHLFEKDAGPVAINGAMKFANNQTFDVQYTQKGKLCAFVRLLTENVVNPNTSTTPISVEESLLTVVNTVSKDFMAKVKENGYVFTIVLNDEGKTVAKVGDVVMADVQLSNFASLRLLNKQVRWVASKGEAICSFDKYPTSIKNIAVREIDIAC